MRRRTSKQEHGSSALGKVYADGQVIVREGDIGDTMFVVQEGRVEVTHFTSDGEQRLAVLEVGDFFGEMAVFDQDARSATVRAYGDARVLTVDRKTLLRRIQEDPLMAVHLLRTMCHRIRELNAALGRVRAPVTLSIEAEHLERTLR